MFNEMYDLTENEAWSSFGREVSGFHELGLHTFYGRISYKSGPWELILDTYSRRKGRNVLDGCNNFDDVEVYTRIRAPFENHDGFICEVYDPSHLSIIGKLFGMQDIEIGDELFDDRFIIKSNNDIKMMLLLKPKRIRELLLLHSDLHLKVNSEQRPLGSFHPEGRNEVYFETNRIISDLDTLRSLSELITLLLNGLCKMDSVCRKQLKLLNKATVRGV